MNGHRYILEPYKGIRTRHHCPSCGKSRTFSRYIDTETGLHIAPSVGRCDREDNCGYHYTPKQYFHDNGTSLDLPQHGQFESRKIIAPPPKKNTSFIPLDKMKESLTGYEENNLCKFLFKLFGAEKANDAISKYFIGSSNHWNGATVFWQVDLKGRIRTGKIMLYSPDNGKRIKEPYNHIHWVHSALKLPEYSLKQCFFGEHLLRGNNKPVAIVESEKTAVIASICFPQYTWLAVGGLTYLNAEKCLVLRRRKVTLFPDLNGYGKWKEKAEQLSEIVSFSISDLLEKKAEEFASKGNIDLTALKKKGYDLADLLINIFSRENTLTEPAQPVKLVQRKQKEPIPEANHYRSFPFQRQREQLVNWANQLDELERYLERATLPVAPFKLNACSTITDIPLFIETHLATARANNGKRTFLPYLDRLQNFKQLLTA